MTAVRGPNTIYLVRHGEKLGDPGNDKDGGVHLLMRGSARAAALPSLFFPGMGSDASPGQIPSCALAQGSAVFSGSYDEQPLGSVVPPRFSAPGFVFATNPDKKASGTAGHKDNDQTVSHRPLETTTPLATALNLTINTHYAESHWR